MHLESKSLKYELSVFQFDKLDKKSESVMHIPEYRSNPSQSLN